MLVWVEGGRRTRFLTLSQPSQFGSYNAAVVSALTAVGKVVALWDVDSLDWSVTGTSNYLSFTQAKLNEATTDTSHIVLLHETVVETSTELLPWILVRGGWGGWQRRRYI